MKPLRSDDSPNARWFADEVRPHEAELRSYLRGKFAAHVDIDDLIQETNARLLQAREQAQVRSTRGFLFTTARNVALDLFRRRRVVVIDGVAEIDLLPVLEDRPGIAAAVAGLRTRAVRGELPPLAALEQMLQGDRAARPAGSEGSRQLDHS